MAAIIWTDVTDIAPELATVGVGAQTKLLAYVNMALDVATWGGEDSFQLMMGRIYLAAHLATANRLAGSGAVGAVIREKVDGLEREYARSSVTSGGDGLDSTTYGSQFKAIRDTLGAVAMVL